MKNYDVIIIGAGPSGIFCAYELIHANKDRRFYDMTRQLRY